MSVILNIDTAIDVATISIARGGIILAEISNSDQKEHGSFLQPAIADLLEKTGLSLNQLDAIAVSAGPGSYTGLRVSMASGKGLCFALNKPLIIIGTLKALAYSAILQMESAFPEDEFLICPMIDARRMEVFTSLFDKNLVEISPPVAMILDKGSFANWLLKYQIFFSGNGSHKWRDQCNHPTARFLEVKNNPLAMSKLSYEKYQNRLFADLNYAEPMYIKGFHSGVPLP